MTPLQRALGDLVARLNARRALRVWSLVITIFGDAVMPRGGRVPLAALQDILARLSIEPGALRTALSRLAADHWVIREKAGRNSLYGLDARGRHAFDLATRKIYAGGPPAWQGKVSAAFALPGTDLKAAAERLAALGFAAAGTAAWLRPHTDQSEAAATADLAGLLFVEGMPLPRTQALGRFWDLAGTAAAYTAFEAHFAPLAAAVAAGSEPAGPLDAMAARTLLVHDWRRIVLHDPGLPAELLPADWPGERARRRAGLIYHRLAGPSEAWLDRAGLPPLDDPAGFGRRFGGAPGAIVR